MRHSMKFLIPTLAASVLLSACGSSSSKTASSTAETQPATSQTSSGTSGAVVKTASNSKLGTTVLVDAQGMTLYHLSAEQGGKFICTSTACVQVWHPLTVSVGSTPTASVGSIGTVKRPDGTEQITYKGEPLYTFAHDTQAGEANGQGIKDVGTWSAVTVATGAAATPASSSGATEEMGSRGGGY